MVEAGTILENRYLLNKQIGSGGMGTVYLATDQRFNSPVAIKETLFDDVDLQHAFEREAQLLNSLRHPALPHVIDYFTENNHQYLVMEYIPGEDLSEILKRKGTFQVAEVLGWVDNLLDAISYLHSRKIPVVHRDIKPQNLKLTPNGEIILLDFGLAKGKPGESSQISRTNSVFGYSRSYAPLEQIQGTGTDTRSDIYSLGATLYHLLTGKPPVDALTRASVFVNNQSDPLVPANTLNPQVPASIAQILHQALNLNADLRPQTVVKLRESLQKAATELLNFDQSVTKFEAASKNLLPPNFASLPSPTNLDSAQKALSIEVPIAAANNFAEVPFEQSHSFSYLTESDNYQPRSTIKSLSVAAAILILGGGSVAAWYATSQPSSSNNQTAVSNSVIGVSSTSKSPIAKAEAKSEIKVEEKNASLKSNSNNVSEARQGNSTNKLVTVKTPNAKPTFEEILAPETPPIKVKSAAPPPNKRSDQEEDEAPAIRPKAKQSERDDDDDEADDSSKQFKNDNDQHRQERANKRERRASEKRRQQKLPTLLGAPQ